MAEAVERYSCGWQGNEPKTRASYRHMSGQAVDPAAILNFSDAQYRNREAWNRVHPGYNWVPMPFDEEAEIDWTPVWSLTRDCVRFVPAACCYYPYPLDDHHRFCRADSNGCAAGNTLEEAVLRGFLELIERDAAAIWWYNRVRRPAVDLESFADPFFAAMRQHLEGERRTLDVIDLTTDLGIPVVAAVSAKDDGGGPLMGFGAHLDARAAVSAALAELSQMVAADPALERIEVRDWLDTATLANQPYLVPATGLASVPAVESREGIRVLVETVARRGLEALVLDLTRPDIGFPVARVIVPGLRHFYARLAPGRLYEIPVQQGWLQSALAEDELNPIPMFL